MKKRILLFASILMLVIFFSGIAIACPKTIVLSVSKSTVEPGGSVQLSADKSGVAYSITQGADSCTLSDDGVISVNETAQIGTIIKAVAKLDKLTSNTVQIEIVHIELESINDAASQFSLMRKGEQAVLSCNVFPTNTTRTVSWVITGGQDRATINGNVITVKENASLGNITLVAKGGNVESQTVTISVVDAVPLQSIQISPAAVSISAGGMVQLDAALNPSNTTDSVTFSITEGSELATVSSTGLVTITTTAIADLGKTVTVVASGAGKTSNQSVITIMEDSLLLSSLVEENILPVKNGSVGTAPKIECVVNNINGDIVSTLPVGMYVEFDLVEGEDIVTLSGSGLSRSVTQVKHGMSKVIVNLVDSLGNIHSQQVVWINSIKTPSIVSLPEFLDYSVFLGGMSNYTVGKDQDISNFIPRIPGVNNSNSPDFGACQEFTYLFEQLDGQTVIASGSSVGTFNSGKIKFNVTGQVRLTITSASGGDTETSVSHVFDVNDYQNVDNFEDLKLALTAEGIDRAAVNIVVTARPVSSDGYNYGFSIVPAFVLNGGFNAVDLAILKELYTAPSGAIDAWYYLEHIGIKMKNRHVVVNGNNHSMDFSRMPNIVYPARIALFRITAETQYSDTIDYLARSIGLRTATSLGALQPEFTSVVPVRDVFINDLKILGNMSRDGKHIGDGSQFAYESSSVKQNRHGTHYEAISIGHYLSRAKFQVQMDNIDIKNFAKGLMIDRAVSETYESETYKSLVSNLSISEAYHMGISIDASQIEFNNVDFGFIGGGSIESLHYLSGTAGIEENKFQRVEFTGSFNISEPGNGDSTYFNDFEIANIFGQSINFKYILSTVVKELRSASMKSHLHFEGESYKFAVFQMIDPFYEDTLKAEANGLKDGPNGINAALWGADPNGNPAVWDLIELRMSNGTRTDRDAVKGNYSIVTFNGSNGVDVKTLDDGKPKNTTEQFVYLDIVGNLFLQKYEIGRVYVINANYVED